MQLIVIRIMVKCIIYLHYVNDESDRLMIINTLYYSEKYKFFLFSLANCVLFLSLYLFLCVLCPNFVFPFHTLHLFIFFFFSGVCFSSCLWWAVFLEWSHSCAVLPHEVLRGECWSGSAERLGLILHWSKEGRIEIEDVARTGGLLKTTEYQQLHKVHSGNRLTEIDSLDQSFVAHWHHSPFFFTFSIDRKVTGHTNIIQNIRITLIFRYKLL